jgi:flagellar biosynthesis protein FlhA
MAGEPRGLTSDLILSHTNVFAALALVGVLALMIVPIPTPLLDVLLTFDIAVAMVVLLVTVYLKQPLEFSVFPSLLLIVTLFRLSLNIASTRLILTNGDAGRVIEAFGHFVVGGNYVIGTIVFVILVVVNFVVITKGAGRIAEVAARFTLDAMPGKQMAIDADLNSGLITEAQARTRRERIAREAEFYGAMDGASKFVRGDAVAGIVITLVNVVGGLVIGVVQHGLPLGEAARRYTLLTIGDGLVTQVPALVVSTAAGMLVTRSASDFSLGEDISRQILRDPRALFASAGALLAFAAIPGLPAVPFLLLAGGTAVAAYVSQGRRKRDAQREQKELEATEAVAEQAPSAPAGEEIFVVDRLELEIGYGLIPLVDATRGGDLLTRVTNVRHKTGAELGMQVAPIRIRDNLQLSPQEYAIKLKGVEIGRFALRTDALLAMRAKEGGTQIEGTATTEPAFHLPARWIKPEHRAAAELAGYTVVEPSAVVATHLTEVIRAHGDEILTRQDVKEMIERLKAHAPALVEELFPEKISLTLLHGVLRGLLHERVPVRDMVTILETLASAVGATNNVEALVERVREALARSLSSQHCDATRTLWSITVHPETEQALYVAFHESERTGSVVMDPGLAERFVTALGACVERTIRAGRTPLLLVSSPIRPFTRRLIEASFPTVAVLGYTEIAAGYQVRSLGTVIAHAKPESTSAALQQAAAYAGGARR